LTNSSPVLESPGKSWAGAIPLRDAAVLLRATTPDPLAPLADWERQPTTFAASTSALAAWIRHGLDWDGPRRVSPRDRVVTFEDLVRLRMIALLRSRGIRYAGIREAEQYARELTGHPQPFVTEPLWTHSSDIFLAVQERFIAATRAGQVALPLLRDFLEPAHHRMEFGNDAAASRWRPAPRITIDPEVRFGEPCIEDTRVPTETIASLCEAGESRGNVARLYGLTGADVAAALAWERRLERAA
jgi:uncharacterized protein (DUF433 family)/DNA-binding transcriptional MerR regulator